MKSLFFDTCAVVKFFINEPGHDVVRWLCESETKALLSLSFSTSEQVEKEFPVVIDRKARDSEISIENASAIKNRAKPYFDSIFHIRDSKPLPNFPFGKDTDEYKIIKKYSLKPEKDIGDAKIISCVVNYLRFLGGASLPHVLTSDKKFKDIIQGEGYRFIDPEKSTKQEIEKYLLSLDNP